MRTAKTAVLAFSAFSAVHWRKVSSNNPLERVNKEMKRRCIVVRIFLDDSVIRLVGAISIEQHDKWATHRRYFSEQSMAKLTARNADDVPAGELRPAG